MLIRRNPSLIFFVGFLNLFLPCYANEEKQNWTGRPLEGIEEIFAQERSFHKLCGSPFPNNKSLEAMRMENRGEPLRTVLVTTWRSGSKFLANILSANPGSFYHYEPLLDFGTVQVRDEPLASKAIQRIKSLLKCDFSEMPIKRTKQYPIPFRVLSSLRQQCNHNRAACWDPNFIAKFCTLFPSQVMKVVRLRLNVAKELLEDESLNLRMVYLIRDPRGILQSRESRDWCKNQIDCSDAATLCQDLESDYKTAKALAQKYPQRFLAVRFEELALDPENKAKDILDFYGLPFNYLVSNYLKTHTNSTDGNPGSTFRDSSSVAFNWISTLKYNQTQTIQESCSKAMSLWGYTLINSEAEQNMNFNPLLPFSI